jgi:hypothetical protein
MPNFPQTPIGTNTDWLLEEYKILQAKIDKIGEHQFKVRSWSAALVTALLASSFARHIPHYIPLLALLIIAAFQLTETRQNRIGEALGKRAYLIERGLRMLSRPTGTAMTSEQERWRTVVLRYRELRNVPGIARALGTPRFSMSLEQALEAETPAALADWLVARADVLFYAIQYAIVIIVTFYLAQQAHK